MKDKDGHLINNRKTNVIEVSVVIKFLKLTTEAFAIVTWKQDFVILWRGSTCANPKEREKH